MNKNFVKNFSALFMIFVLCTGIFLPTYAAYDLGDVNGDGTITSLDYFRIKACFRGIFSFNEEAFKAADTNGDGAIGTIDYLKVKRAFLIGPESIFTKEQLIEREYNATSAEPVKLAIWGPPNPETYTTDSNIEKLDVLCKKYVELGLTHIYNEGEWGVVTMTRILDCYEKYGLKAIIGIPNHDHDWALSYVQATMNHPACWGFNIKDEPASSQLFDMTSLANKIKAVLPEGKQITINLLPNTSFTDGALSNISLSEYDRHVRQFLNGIKPDVLSFDSYPLTTSSTITSLEMVYYLRNLLEINTQCRDAGVEATSIIQSASWSGQRMPTATELQFLTNMNLVSGMDGITYFLFYSHTGMNGLVNTSWGNNTLYRVAANINKGITNMKGIFKKYDQVGYIFTNMPSAYRNYYSGVADSSVNKTSYGPVKSVSSTATVLSGCFTDDAGNKALYVMNYSMTAGADKAIKLSFTGETSYKVWDFNGLSDMDKGTELTLNLGPGEAAFVQFG